MTQRERELECVIADLTAQARIAEKERDALRAELDALKARAAEWRANSKANYAGWTLALERYREARAELDALKSARVAR